MSTKELDRLEVLGRVLERRLTQRQAAEQLGLGLRQVERLCRALRSDGAGGLVSRKRGRPSNRKLPEAVRKQALDLVRGRYADFGPTLACEKLGEQHSVGVSRETLRRWMTDAGLWLPRAQRLHRAHQPRHRRSCLEGYRVEGVTIDPPRVRISGARAEVLRLSEVVTEMIDVTGATASLEREVRVSPGAG